MTRRYRLHDGASCDDDDDDDYQPDASPSMAAAGPPNLAAQRGDQPARQRSIQAGRPQTNGCVERVQRTILEECRKPAFARHLIPKQSGLRRDLVRYLEYDNADRAHAGRRMRGRTPDSVLGKTKIWS